MPTSPSFPVRNLCLAESSLSVVSEHYEPEPAKCRVKNTISLCTIQRSKQLQLEQILMYVTHTRIFLQFWQYLDVFLRELFILQIYKK